VEIPLTQYSAPVEADVIVSVSTGNLRRRQTHCDIRGKELFRNFKRLCDTQALCFLFLRWHTDDRQQLPRQLSLTQTYFKASSLDWPQGFGLGLERLLSRLASLNITAFIFRGRIHNLGRGLRK